MGTSTLVPLVAAVGGLWVGHLFASEVPEPYMDELFHIPQAQAYCRGFPRVGSVPHDPMITTFPGVYLVSALASALVGMAVGRPMDALGGGCSVGFLRGVNAVLACIGACLAYSLVVRGRATCKRLMEKTDADGQKRWIIDGDTRSAIDAALVTTFPLHAFFVWLFYTDTASTVFVLATWLALLEKRYALSGVLAGCSISMRQTNAVWVICLVGWDVADAALGGQRLATSLGLGAQLVAIVRYLRSNLATCVHRYGLHAAAVFAFASFVVWNGGIVIGDRANHVPVHHWVQPFYFYSFLVLSTGPLWFGRAKRNCLSLRGITLWAALVALVALALVAVHWGTLVHPFMLADNRHLYLLPLETRDWRLRLVQVLRCSSLRGVCMAGHLLPASGRAGDAGDQDADARHLHGRSPNSRASGGVSVFHHPVVSPRVAARGATVRRPRTSRHRPQGHHPHGIRRAEHGDDIRLPVQELSVGRRIRGAIFVVSATVGPLQEVSVGVHLDEDTHRSSGRGRTAAFGAPLLSFGQ